MGLLSDMASYIMEEIEMVRKETDQDEENRIWKYGATGFGDCTGMYENKPVEGKRSRGLH